MGLSGQERSLDAPVQRGPRARMRKTLLTTAMGLMEEGLIPSVSEVAEAAEVSRATAYRYFPNVEALFAEAALDVAFPTERDVFAGKATDDPAERLERADAALHDMIVKNEVPLRLMLARSLERSVKAPGEDDLPLRQNRRTPLIEAALAPGRSQFERGKLNALTAALKK